MVCFSRALYLVVFSAAAIGMAQMAFPDIGRARSAVKRIFEVIGDSKKETFQEDISDYYQKDIGRPIKIRNDNLVKDNQHFMHNDSNIPFSPKKGQTAGKESCRATAVIVMKESVFESANECASITEDLKPPTGHVEFCKVVYAYPSRPQINVLDGLTLNISPGTSMALVGGSGCGKSTTIALLMRFCRACEGRVLLDGADINDYAIQWLRRQIGWIGQEPCLFSTSIFDNLTCGWTEATEESVNAAAIAADAHEFIVNLPNGYNTIVGDGGIQLSGGQKQRLSIARALLRKPKVLLLDEITSSLDSQSEKMVQETLNKLLDSQDVTCLLTAHRLHTVQAADCIAVLSRGAVIEQGTHTQLMSIQEGHYLNLVRAYSGS